jgi:hypothetical protein
MKETNHAGLRLRENGRNSGQFLHRGIPSIQQTKGTTMKKLKISAIAIAMGLAFSTVAMAQGMSKDPYPSEKDGMAVGTSTSAKSKDSPNEMGADARKDAQSDKGDAQGDANYAAAKEKCDALAGDAKSTCMSDAKARFGKM